MGCGRFVQVAKKVTANVEKKNNNNSDEKLFLMDECVMKQKGSNSDK